MGETPGRSKVDVCVIIPTYNERENIAELVAQILALDGDMRIIVVDDNSPDGTGQLVDELVEQHDRVGVIHRKGKLGLGTAYIAGLKKGMEEGAGRLITMDADFSHHPGAIPALLELANRFPIALGSRYVPAGNVLDWGRLRRVLSWGANTFARVMLGLQARDCTTGFRCYRREVLLAVDLQRVFSDGYSFLVEILFRCHRRGYLIGETPIVFVNRKRGRSKISRREIYKAVYTVMRLSVTRLMPWRVM